MNIINELNKNDFDNINTYVKKLINNTFTSMVDEHKFLLIKYLTKSCILVGTYFYNNNFIKQLSINNSKTIKF